MFSSGFALRAFSVLRATQAESGSRFFRPPGKAQMDPISEGGTDLPSTEVYKDKTEPGANPKKDGYAEEKEKEPDNTLRLIEKGVGTITYDTSFGKTAVG